MIKYPTYCFTWEKAREKEKGAAMLLYRNADRSKFIVAVPTQCHDDPKAFAFAGAAFILNQ